MMRKQAFLFLVRQIDAATLDVMKMLDDPQHDFYVHVDAKSGPVALPTIAKALKYSHVVLVPRVAVGWAAYSMVAAEMQLLREATSAKTLYAYYHLLSESDFPLVSNQKFQAFFTDKDLEFVEIERNNDVNTRNRLRYYYPLQERLGKRHGFYWLMQKGLLVVEHLLRVNRLKHVQELPIIAKGSQWFSITDDFAKYVVSNSALVTRVCRVSRAPDEVFLQTLLLNSKFASKLAPQTSGNLRYIRWGQGNSPKSLGPKDFQALQQSGKLFARKISGLSDGLALRQLVRDEINKE
ncbi:beta-1,6-N-acetylglucosaminyltransferase [Lacticaseibacillus manihotivorans]|nr:beta-1,6-N-acetylglucosaminyltransferase [Lacticaseibacillus manihotivorans]QFQ92435.1 glycosyl transferase family 14 [Lacticaseibacillus manihotivorans]